MSEAATDAEQGVLVAISSKDGIAINQHFGHAREFRIFRLLADGFEYIDKREVALYCGGPGNDSKAAMADILTTIKDCDLLLTAKAGDGPKAKLAAIGVTVLEDFAYEAIDDGMQALLQRYQAGELVSGC
ncbi:NifB/NifX family molybdenum-iron cluster-binding protein [Oceanobacter mangrovi]|uniref:NifB/NifX family molybdenum-iron cluster-binding protein n=1 Tax=Oceanobacter mangrovi TaxID=2862510 RepID=UPI001C8D0106|nr:NifB/NifX family molybdenum-iron cluster-binding protein [Oceanobacter mangrovi]